MRSTSASTCDRSKRRFRLAAGVPWVWRTRRTAIHSHGQGFLAATLPGNALWRANRDSLRGSGADSECDTWPYAVEFPIRPVQMAIRRIGFVMRISPGRAETHRIRHKPACQPLVWLAGLVLKAVQTFLANAIEDDGNDEQH